MAEKSYFWGATIIGDGVYEPFSSKEFADIISPMFTFSRNFEGVIDTVISPYTSRLAITNPAGATIRIAPGLALVRGRLYENDANVDFTLTGAGFYRVVVRMTEATQTAVLTLLGPDALPPALTNDEFIWDLYLAQINWSGAAVTSLSDVREFTPDRILLDGRQGGRPSLGVPEDGDWATPGTINYQEGDLFVICGSFVPTALTTMVDFADYVNQFSLEVNPLVYIQIYSTQTTIGITDHPYVAEVGAYWFTVTLDSLSNIEAIHWAVLGHAHNER